MSTTQAPQKATGRDTLVIGREHLAPVGLFDHLGRELTQAHYIFAVRDLLGEPLIRLIKHQQRHLDDPDHPIHQDVQDAVHARMKGAWRIDRYNAPIEYYAAQAMGVREDQIPNFHALPAAVKAQADALLKRNHRAESSDWEETFENLFLTAGVSALWNQAAGAAPAANSGGSAAASNALFNAAQAMIGVGDSTTAAAAGQTDLQASANKSYVGMDATFPTLPASNSNQIVFRATFGTAAANYSWNEFVVSNRGGSNSNTSGGSCLDRVVSAQGTKASGQTLTARVHD